MKRIIITDINFLRQKSEEIKFQGIELQSCELINVTIKDLEDSLDLNKGCGLSAIQIGIKLKVSIIRLPNFSLNLWNPKIIERNKPYRHQQEGCLSLPGLRIDTKRYDNIVIENGDRKRYVLNGIEACVVQHEIAHLNGRIILDDKWHKRK